MTTETGIAADVAGLRETVHELERRITELESRGADPGRASAAAPTGDGPVVDLPALPSFSSRHAAALLGRSLLVLAGAFLLRALTDQGVLPAVVGVGLGLLYALALIILADRAASRDDRLGGNIHGLTALIIGFPFLAETVGRLGLVPPLGGALALVVLAGAGLATAWRRHLRFFYWALSLGALAVTIVLLAATGDAVVYTILLMGLGATTVVFSYGRGWYLARWPTALVVDVVILRLVVMSSNPDGATTAGRPVTDSAVLALALSLLAIYLGLFVTRALAQGRGVKSFDVVQSLLVVAIGFGGAAHVARQVGGGAYLGVLALVLACAGYTVAFTVVRQRHGRGRAFFYFASLAMLLLVLGSELLASGPWLAWTWTGLGLAAALLGGHYDRVTLRAHAAVYLALAAVRTGLFAAVADAFVGDPATPWSGLGASALVALAVTGVCYMLMARTPGQVSRLRRVPRFLVAILTLMGLGYVVVTLLVRLVGDPPPAAGPAAVAVIRTCVLALTAVTMALAARRETLAELGWLVYPLLALGCAKLLVEDLSRGDAVSLTVGFALFGAALILAPRMLHQGRAVR